MNLQVAFLSRLYANATTVGLFSRRLALIPVSSDSMQNLGKIYVSRIGPESGRPFIPSSSSKFKNGSRWMSYITLPSLSSPSGMWSPLEVPLTGEKPFTDYSRWRLVVNDGGRHTWEYLRTDNEVKHWPQTDLDKFWLGLKTVCIQL